MTKDKRKFKVSKQPNSRQSIFRVKKEECPYVQLDKRIREILEDACMSWEEKGMLTFLLSR